MNVCCTTLLSSELQARSSNREAYREGKGSGEKGILSGVVPVYL